MNEKATVFINIPPDYKSDWDSDEPNLLDRIYMIGSSVYQLYKSGTRTIELKGVEQNENDTN